MTRNLKIGLALGVVGLGIGAYFLVQYMKLKKAYSTTLSENEAESLIQAKTQLVPNAIIPDEITASVSQDEDVSNGVVAQQEEDNFYNNDLRLFETQSGMGDL
jgi:hypothetical protein